MSLNPFYQTPPEQLKHSLVNIVKDKESRHHFFSVISIIFLFFSIFVGIFIGLLQKQEIRKEASADNNKAELILVPSSTPLRADTLSTVFIRLDTHGQSVDGVQVVFDLFTDVTDQVSVQVKEGQGLRRAWDKVEGIENGKRVSFATISNDPYQSFYSNSPTDIAEVTFVAKKPGNLAMVFDQFMTKVNKHQQLKNILKPIVIQEYKIATAPTPVPKPIKTVSPIPTQSPVISPTAVSSKGGVETNEVTDSVMAKVALTSEVSTITQSVCNDPCQFSTQCGKDFLCYEGSCRLATNLSSTNCQDIAQRSKSCNQDCSQAIECQTGLTCFENKCRTSSNPQSQTCLSSQGEVPQLCGNSCSVNTDCGDSLSCFAGECRLATNPSSTNCLDTEVVVRNLGSDQDTTKKVVDDEESLSVLTQVLIALALTVVIGLVGVMGYSFVKRKRDIGEF